MKDINKVMIIDDKETFIFPLEMGLKKRGIDVISFTDPIEAIEYLKNNTVHVLLTDYHMEPNINGDEVIRRVREFNKDIVIYLQTGYAETLPADEMLEKYDIQGYIDKGEGQDKNIQLIKASLKQAELIELVKQQQAELDAQSCRNEFLGKFLNRLMGEIGERSMAMVGSVMHLNEMENDIPESQKEVFINSVNTLKNSTTKLNELIKSIEVSQDVITVGELERKLRNLFDITFAVKDVKLNIKCADQYTMLDCNQEIILHILVDIIEELVNKEEKEINILVEKTDKVRVKVCNNLTNIGFLDKLNKLSYLDEKINIVTEFEQLVLEIG